MTRKILITGPESTGKTTLAKYLARVFSGSYVPEYAREYLEARHGHYDYADLGIMHNEHLARQHAASQTNAKWIFCDTGPEVFYVWSEEKYGRVSKTILEALHSTSYDYHFLCWPEFPWAPDPLREHPDPADRLRLANRYAELLEALNWAPRTILNPEQRPANESQQTQAVNALRNYFMGSIP